LSSWINVSASLGCESRWNRIYIYRTSDLARIPTGRLIPGVCDNYYSARAELRLTSTVLVLFFYYSLIPIYAYTTFALTSLLYHIYGWHLGRAPVLPRDATGIMLNNMASPEIIAFQLLHESQSNTTQSLPMTGHSWKRSGSASDRSDMHLFCASWRCWPVPWYLLVGTTKEWLPSLYLVCQCRTETSQHGSTATTTFDGYSHADIIHSKHV